MSLIQVPSGTKNNYVNWSFSSLSTFVQCPRRKWFQDNTPYEPYTSPEMSYGSFGHKCIENVFRGIPIPDIPTMTQEQANVWLMRYANGQKLGDTIKAQVLDMGIQPVYLENYPINDSYPVLANWVHGNFKIPMHDLGCNLTGKIDFIGVDVNGYYGVIDWKTSEGDFESWQINSSAQLRFYQLVLENIGLAGRVGWLAYGVIPTDTYEAIISIRKPFSSEEMTDLRTQLAIKTKEYRSSQFIRQPGYGCRYCGFLPKCFDVGGDF